jgi:hypothetical protein
VYWWVIHEINSWFTKWIPSSWIKMSYKKSLLSMLNATCRDFPRYIPSLNFVWLFVIRVSCHWVWLFVIVTRLLSLFGKNVPKIIFAPFRPQFSEHVAQFQHSGAPSGKVGPSFKLTFFWTEYCLCSRCIIQKWLDKCNWNWTKSICQITRNHKRPYKREEIYRGKSLHVA